MAGRWRGTLRRALSLPPHILMRKVAGVITRKLRRHYGRARDQVLGTSISNSELWSACGGRFRSPEALARHFCTRQSPKFFVSASERAVLGPAIRTALDPAIVAATVRQADDALAHRFDLLGSGPVELGAKIDWHTDFKSGHRWPPGAYYADCRYAPFPGGFDIKVPWELSRLQHLVWLGQAYWLSGESNYVRDFQAQVSDWIESNPPRRGVNWTCTMDVAIRAVNFVWAYELFRDSPLLDDAFHVRLVTSLLAHGRHILANLEWSPELTSNHYLSNIAGLVYLGVYLPQLDEAEHWRTFGLTELAREMRKQVYDDGADFEASVSYHRLVVELFFSPALLAKLNGNELPVEFWQRLERMFEFTMFITKPNGAAPQLGDNDNGRLHRLQAWPTPEREWIDHRYLLAIGAMLFGRSDFAVGAGDQWAEAIWLFGPAAIKKQVSLPAQPQYLPSRAFPDAGIYLLRHGEAYLVVDAGPPGQNGVGGHSHQDLLSFELAIGSQDWIVDPGTYLYTADYLARNRFRSTAAHNTIAFDGAEQNRLPLDHLFHTPYDARLKVVHWQSTADFDLLVAEHTGYQRLPGKVIHRRTFFFDKAATAWLIVDEFRGSGRHAIAGSLHVAAGVTAQLLAPGEVRLVGACANPTLSELPKVSLRIHSRDVTFSVEAGELSPSFGVCVPGEVLRYGLHVDLDRSPSRIAMAIASNAGDKTREQVQVDRDRLEERLRQVLPTKLPS